MYKTTKVTFEDRDLPLTIGSGAFIQTKNSPLSEVYVASLEDWLGITFDGYSASPTYQGATLYVSGETLTDVAEYAGASRSHREIREMISSEAVNETEIFKVTVTSTDPQEAERLVKDAVLRCQSREEEIVRQANMEAAAIREKASADIAQERKKAVAEAKGEISDLAMEIAQKMIGKSLDDKDQKRLVDSFIDELGEQ